MADIRKRDGKKGVRYQVRYPNQSAKSGHSFKTFRTMKEARAFSENSYVWDRNSIVGISVSDAVDQWLNICEKIGRDGREPVEEQTLYAYFYYGNAIKEYQWNANLKNISSSDVVNFRTWLILNKTRYMAKRILSALQSVFNEMKVQGHVEHNPASGITIKISGRFKSEEVEIPSDSEIKSILEATESLLNKNSQMQTAWHRYRPLIYLAVFSGLRPSEYRGLTWSNISERRISITQRADKNCVIGTVKSGAARRTIYVPKLVTDMLFSWKQYCPQSKDDLVFPTQSGKPMRLEGIRRSCWLPLIKEAGITHVIDGKLKSKYKLNSLRHYFASKLIESQKDGKYIQTMMGHSSIELTFNVYGHLMKGNSEKHEEDADKLIKAVLG